MRYRARKECWFGRLFRIGEEADFASGTRVPETLFEPLDQAPATGQPRMAELRRQARELGVACRRTWTAADLTAAIAAATPSGPSGQEASHGQ
ncbi:MAG: hypothetical protein AB1916_15450 [Thermodesulfobacteriota bacterium]